MSKKIGRPKKEIGTARLIVCSFMVSAQEKEFLQQLAVSTGHDKSEWRLFVRRYALGRIAIDPRPVFGVKR